MVCKPTANGTESGQYVKNCCTASLGRQFIQNSRSAQTTGIQTPAETRPGVEVDLPPPAKTESYLGHHQLEPSQVPFAVNMPRISLPGSSLLVVLALILCLSLPIRAVPTSVLAQDTELSTSANHKLQQQQQQQQHHQHLPQHISQQRPYMGHNIMTGSYPYIKSEPMEAYQQPPNPMAPPPAPEVLIKCKFPINIS